MCPTKCSTPASSYNPSRRDPIPSSCRDGRYAPTTTSAVLTFFTFTMTRSPGRYVWSSRFATTPSRPSGANVSNHASASSGSSVCGVIRTCVDPAPGTPVPSRPESIPSSAARRSENGAPISERSSTASTSNATNDAGVSAASIRTRDSAGWIRSWSRSKSSPAGPATTISPSTALSAGNAFESAAGSSGKYRFSGRLSRLWISTSPRVENTMARKPSHFGS